MIDCTLEQILNNISSVKDEVLDYIESTEHCLFNWISNKEIQNFIREYPEDYEDRFHITVCYVSSTPLIRISFDEHPDGISYIEGYAFLETFRDTTKARWLEWNGKVKELQILGKKKELNYYKNMVDKTEKEIKELEGDTIGKEFTSHSTFTLNDYVVHEGESNIFEESDVKPKCQEKR